MHLDAKRRSLSQKFFPSQQDSRNLIVITVDSSDHTQTLAISSYSFLSFRQNFKAVIGIIKSKWNICLTSLTRAKPKEKMEFPA